MAIAEEWTDPATLEVTVGDLPRAPWANALLGNFTWLYSGPRVTLVRDRSWIVDSSTDRILGWSHALVDSGGWWSSGAPTVAVVPRDGVYVVSLRLLWNENVGGTFRRWRLLRNGDPVGGGRSGATAFAEHADTIHTALNAGDAISIDMRHNHTGAIEIFPENMPVWRSPILMASWFAPLDGSQ